MGEEQVSFSWFVCLVCVGLARFGLPVVAARAGVAWLANPYVPVAVSVTCSLVHWAQLLVRMQATYNIPTLFTVPLANQKKAQ